MKHCFQRYCTIINGPDKWNKGCMATRGKKPGVRFLSEITGSENQL